MSLCTKGHYPLVHKGDAWGHRPQNIPDKSSRKLGAKGAPLWLLPLHFGAVWYLSNKDHTRCGRRAVMCMTEEWDAED